ncbi:MAG: hypothetical protein CMJ78_25855 [Planctomycetaceae bacterium]|nr:hypothetical protein [Planctomycetaceae bacterium]
MSVSLVPINDGRPIVLDKAIILVGRHPDCDVVLTSSRKISRKHCCIANVNNRFLVRDLGSMNGVWINGQRIERQSEIEFGDELSIGDIPFNLVRQELSTGRESQSEPAEEDAPGGHPTPQKLPKPPAHLDISQEVPVAIPEQPDSFMVEPSINYPSSGPIPLADDDVDEGESEEDGIFKFDDE